MRYIFIFFIAVYGNLFGQNISKVNYTETMFLDNLGIQLPPQWASSMPKSRDLQKTLFVKGSESMFVINKEAMDKKIEEHQRRGEGRGMSFSFRKSNFKDEVYTNSDELQVVTLTELFGKEFLIEEEKEYAWKIHAGEQRDIIGHTCIKATCKVDTMVVTAWYAPKINIPSGPNGYYGLPGLILALSEGENKVYLATSIEENLAEAPPFTRPTTGEKVTREKFNKIRDEKIKEMGKMFSGRGMGGPGGAIFIKQ